MKKSANNLCCEEFQSQLPDLIGSGEKVADHPHLQGCSLCRALLADLAPLLRQLTNCSPWRNLRMLCGEI